MCSSVKLNCLSQNLPSVNLSNVSGLTNKVLGSSCPVCIIGKSFGLSCLEDITLGTAGHAEKGMGSSLAETSQMGQPAGSLHPGHLLTLCPAKIHLSLARALCFAAVQALPTACLQNDSLAGRGGPGMAASEVKSLQPFDSDVNPPSFVLCWSWGG